MGRPNLINQCQALHAGLIERLGATSRIPRKQWDFLVCRILHQSLPMARVTTATGEAHGLWTVSPGRGPGNGGHVSLVPLQARVQLIEKPTSTSPIEPVILAL